jgi:DNA-binding transcriptional MerR regulator
MEASDEQNVMTVDELARHAQLPVRTIREYQTMRLLPPPNRRGRIGLYGDEHRRRLDLIARLQQRGYSLAGIKDLLDAWATGTNLPDILGVDAGPPTLDEAPLRLTRRELSNRLPGLTPTSIRRAQKAGLVAADGPNHFLVRSPALLAVVVDGVDAGVRLNDMIDFVDSLRDELAAVADKLADQIVKNVWRPLALAGRASEIDPLLRRGRLLLVQAIVSMLIDRLGAALLHRAETVPNGDELRAAIERVRVGVVTDTRGKIRRRR